ncbi:hypothetical protein BDW69DRAFT_177094 [Aspergillus filifer]
MISTRHHHTETATIKRRVGDTDPPYISPQQQHKVEDSPTNGALSFRLRALRS